MPSKTYNPFSTVTGAVEQAPAKVSHERVRTAVFVVLAAHALLLMGLLVGCNSEPSARSIAAAYSASDQVGR